MEKKKLKIPKEIDAIPVIPFHKRKTRFILTLILTVIISVTLVIGGFTSYFTMKSQTFITVDGKEVLTPDVIQDIQSQMSGLPIGETADQKMSQVLQSLSGLQQNAMWASFAMKKGINFSPSDIRDSLKQKYNDEKTAYEQKNNNYFPLNYNTFVNNSAQNFNTSSFYNSISAPITPDYLTVAMEYSAQSTTSVVEYAYVDLKDYLANNPTPEFNAYYNNLTTKEIASKLLKVLVFNTEDEAIKQNKAFDDEKDVKIKQDAFNNSKDMLTIDSKKDDETFTLLQNYKVNAYTVPFKYKGKYYLGKIMKDNALSFNELSVSAKASIAEPYISALPAKEKTVLIDKIKDVFAGKLNLNVLTEFPFVHYGTTAPFNISKEQEIKDAKDKSPLAIGDSTNNEFFKASFKKEGIQSPLLEYKNILYKVKVLKRENPVFPMSQKDIDAIKESIKDRENNMWYLYFNNKLKDSVKVTVNYKAISTLFNIK